MARHALIVGVGTYDISGHDLDTPVANARLMAEAAIALGFSPQNIHVIVSGAKEADIAAFRDLDLNPASTKATRAEVEDLLVKDLASFAPTELLVYWSGHGIVREGQRYFLCADYTRDTNDRLFSLQLFRNRLTSRLFQSVETCWFTADVCGSSTALPIGTPGTVVEHDLAAPDCLYAFATPELVAARSADGHGVFTALLSNVFASLTDLPTPKELADKIEAEAALGQPFQLVVEGQCGDQAFSRPLRLMGTPAPSGLPCYLEKLYTGLCEAKLPLSAAEAAYRATYSALGNSKLALRPLELKDMLTELAQTGDDPDQPTLWLGVFVAVLKEKLGRDEAEILGVLQGWQAAEIGGDLGERVRRKSRQILLEAAKLLVIEVETRSPDHLVEVRTTLREEDFRACIEPSTLYAEGVEVATWDEVFERLVEEIDHLLDAEILKFSIHVVVGHGLETIDLHRRTWVDTETEVTAPLGQEFGILLHYMPRHLRKPTRRWRGDHRSKWLRRCDPLLSEAAGKVAGWVSVTKAEQALAANTLTLCYVSLASSAGDCADVAKILLDQGAPCIYWHDSALTAERPPSLSEDPDRFYLDKMRDKIRDLRASQEAHGPLVWDVMPSHLTLLDGEGEEESQ
ncbi:caspase family protein [Roseibium sp. MMSF_3412]|uniref:caspase family protein n=1 Tax=Roseibium sp. MMSF_3412 TaxID=3046712 RepID=UPI00273F41F4|nr:caspase family protein [Roseibium sp. MMSF_3412]